MPAPQQIMINLLEIDQSQVRKKKLVLTTTVLIIALLGVLAGAYFSAFSAYREQQAINKDLKVEMTRYHKLQASLKASESFKQELMVKSNTVAEIEALQISYIRILNEISLAAAPGTLIIHIQIAPEKIRISGFSPDHHEVARFLSGLRESLVFKEAKMVSSEVESGSEEYKFTIESEWGLKE